MTRPFSAMTGEPIGESGARKTKTRARLSPHRLSPSHNASKARADLTAQHVASVGLRVMQSPPPPRHAHVFGWPTDRDEMMSVAQELAACFGSRPRRGTARIKHGASWPGRVSPSSIRFGKPRKHRAVSVQETARIQFAQLLRELDLESPTPTHDLSTFGRARLHLLPA